MIGKVIGTDRKSFFPSGYKYVTTGTFPGLSSRVIPILVSWNCDSSAMGSSWTTATANCYYNNGSKYFTIGTAKSRTSATQAYSYGNAYGIAFLPHYFGYNWELMKTISNAGGTVVAWLEKSGGGVLN